MSSVKGIIGVTLGSLAILCAMYFYRPHARVATKQARPNILVLSLCSVRQNHMSAYGYDRDTTPHLSEFANHGFVFRNAISAMSWTNALTYLEPLTSEFFIEHGYRTPGIFGKYMRIPRDRGLELEYKTGFEYLKQLLLTPDIRPFFLEAHIKYQHFPYVDFLNRRPESEENEYFLSKNSRLLLKKYLADPRKYPEKLPFLTVLLRDKSLILSHPRIKEWVAKGKKYFDPAEPFGIVNNPELLEEWKRSEGYADDLSLLKEAYDSKLRYFDSLLGDVLNLYGDEELLKNTIVVVVGDHGESFMDHGYLLHGETVYDEILRFPILIRFPGAEISKPVYIDRQFYQGGFLKLIQGLAEGTLNSSSIYAFAEQANPTDDAIVSRNCRGNLRSLRFENHWKLIVDISTRERWLYDLKTDPGEEHDVYNDHPELTGKLEELLSKNFDRTGNPWESSCSGFGVE
jgi:hypothetical protein